MKKFMYLFVTLSFVLSVSAFAEDKPADAAKDTVQKEQVVKKCNCANKDCACMKDGKCTCGEKCKCKGKKCHCDKNKKKCHCNKDKMKAEEKKPEAQK